MIDRDDLRVWYGLRPAPPLASGYRPLRRVLDHRDSDWPPAPGIPIPTDRQRPGSVPGAPGMPDAPSLPGSPALPRGSADPASTAGTPGRGDPDLAPAVAPAAAPQSRPERLTGRSGSEGSDPAPGAAAAARAASVAPIAVALAHDPVREPSDSPPDKPPERVADGRSAADRAPSASSIADLRPDAAADTPPAGPPALPRADPVRPPRIRWAIALSVLAVVIAGIGGVWRWLPDPPADPAAWLQGLYLEAPGLAERLPDDWRAEAAPDFPGALGEALGLGFDLLARRVSGGAMDPSTLPAGLPPNLCVAALGLVGSDPGGAAAAPARPAPPGTCLDPDRLLGPGLGLLTPATLDKLLATGFAEGPVAPARALGARVHHALLRGDTERLRGLLAARADWAALEPAGLTGRDALVHILAARAATLPTELLAGWKSFRDREPGGLDAAGLALTLEYHARGMGGAQLCSSEDARTRVAALLRPRSGLSTTDWQHLDRVLGLLWERCPGASARGALLAWLAQQLGSAPLDPDGAEVLRARLLHQVLLVRSAVPHADGSVATGPSPAALRSLMAAVGRPQGPARSSRAEPDPAALLTRLVSCWGGRACSGSDGRGLYAAPPPHLKPADPAVRPGPDPWPELPDALLPALVADLAASDDPLGPCGRPTGLFVCTRTLQWLRGEGRARLLEQARGALALAWDQARLPADAWWQFAWWAEYRTGLDPSRCDQRTGRGGLLGSRDRPCIPGGWGNGGRAALTSLVVDEWRHLGQLGGAGGQALRSREGAQRFWAQAFLPGDTVAAVWTRAHDDRASLLHRSDPVARSVMEAYWYLLLPDWDIALALWRFDRAWAVRDPLAPAGASIAPDPRDADIPEEREER